MIVFAGIAIVLGFLFTIGLAIKLLFRKSTAQKLNKLGLEPDNTDTNDIFDLNDNVLKPTTSANLTKPSLDLSTNDIEDDIFATSSFSDTEKANDFFSNH